MAKQKRLSNRKMGRRDLITGAASIGALSLGTVLFTGCPQIQSTDLLSPAERLDVVGVLTSTLTPQPATGATKGMAQVAFVKTRDRVQGVRRAIDLLGLPNVQNKQILLKPNFNSADPTPGSTHPDLLRALVELFWDGGARTITVGDRSGMGNTRQVMATLGLFDLARDLDFDAIVFDELERSAWELIQPYESHWQQGFPFPACCLDADLIVQTCCLKTHRYGGHFTLSLKNSVGMAAKYRPGDNHNYMTELHGSQHQRRMIAEINSAYSPALIILDGVDAFVTGGPANGKLVESNVILAGTDRIAIDAVGVALLRHFGTTPEVHEGAIFEQEQIARAVELELGIASPSQIDLVTGDAESAAYAAEILPLLG